MDINGINLSYAKENSTTIKGTSNSFFQKIKKFDFKDNGNTKHTLFTEKPYIKYIIASDTSNYILYTVEIDTNDNLLVFGTLSATGYYKIKSGTSLSSDGDGIHIYYYNPTDNQITYTFPPCPSGYWYGDLSCYISKKEDYIMIPKGTGKISANASTTNIDYQAGGKFNAYSNTLIDDEDLIIETNIPTFLVNCGSADSLGTNISDIQSLIKTYNNVMNTQTTEGINLLNKSYFTNEIINKKEYDLYYRMAYGSVFNRNKIKGYN